MKTKIFIVSESKVKQYTPLNNNVDDKIITNSIRTIQDIDLQTLIGTKLYRSVLDKLSNGTLTGIYKTLVEDFIEDYLIYAVYYDVLDEVYIRPRNNGLLIPTGGDNSTQVNDSQYNSKRQGVKNKVEFYAERIAKYLCDSQASFVELDSVEFLYELYPNLNPQYGSPFVFGRSRTAKMMEDMGIKVINSRYSHLPQ